MGLSTSCLRIKLCDRPPGAELHLSRRLRRRDSNRRCSPDDQVVQQRCVPGGSRHARSRIERGLREPSAERRSENRQAAAPESACRQTASAQNPTGCAAAAALAEGRLDPGRWASYRKLGRELRAVEVRASARLRIEERRRWKGLQKEAKRRMEAKRRFQV